MNAALRLLFVPALLALGGCHSLGPATVARDRSDYSSAITESWKRQTLLNIVKLRYVDPPIYIDVGQIVAGYQFELYGSVGRRIGLQGADSFADLGANGRYIDRPTITYTPMTGAKFIAGLITPLPPSSLFSAVQAGWPADAMLTVGLISINGLRNEHVSASARNEADPRFRRAVSLMAELQRSGAVSIRVVPKSAEHGGNATLLTFRAHDIDPALAERAAELRALLGLDPHATEFTLVTGYHAESPTHIAVQTRSIMHVTQILAVHVEIPDADVAEGRARPGSTVSKPDRGEGAGIGIRSSTTRPSVAYAAVRYRDRWFWIDDRDLASKHLFSLLMLLFTMTDTSGEGRAPLLTIST
jgi:hypothetical protein